MRPDPDNPNTWLWNPAGATLEEACAAVGCGAGTMAIAGGTEVFSLFLTIGYDVFYLARAEEVRLPGGVPVFAQGRGGRSPEATLRDAGLKPAESRAARRRSVPRQMDRRDFEGRLPGRSIITVDPFRMARPSTRPHSPVGEHGSKGAMRLPLPPRSDFGDAPLDER